MRKNCRYIVLILIAAAFLAAVWCGVERYGFPDSSNSATVLKGPWKYETGAGDTGVVYLPYDLEIPVGTNEITITASLPEWDTEGYAILFKTAEQTVEVRIEGELRYTYGGAIDAEDYVYRSAANTNEVPLKLDDSGKEITITFRSSDLFQNELGHMRAVWFGTQGDLILHQFSEAMPVMFISMFTLLIVLAAFLMAITYRGAPWKHYVSLLVLTVLSVMFMNLENAALWPVFHHDPTLSSLSDWTFFFLDPLIPMASWLALYIVGWRFRRWQRFFALGVGCVYILAAAVSLFGVFNFNLMRPIFMAVSFVLSLLLVLGHRRDYKTWPPLALPVWCLLLGYNLDYLRYFIVLLPFTSQFLSLIHLELNFQFCTGIALMVFSILILRTTMSVISRLEADTKAQAATAQIQAQYAIQQYESICQRDASTRQLRHDMQHHFRTAASLLEQGKSAEAERYLAGLVDTAASLQTTSYCSDHVADITISWYADRFSEAEIPFHAEANIPRLREEVHADVCCILSNALQNALEGSQGVSSPGVELQARPQGNSLIIRIKNRTVLKDATQFPTTKKGEGHGLGLDSMRSAAQRHNGYFHAETKNGEFSVYALLSNAFEQQGE